MVFKKIRNAFSGSDKDVSFDEDYLEIDLEQEKKEKKVVVKLFELKDYDDSNAILNSLREGYTIALIDIKVLKKKDPIELKRAISKIRKTSEALEGSITGFGGTDIVVVTPSFARIDKAAPKAKEKKDFEDF